MASIKKISILMLIILFMSLTFNVYISNAATYSGITKSLITSIQSKDDTTGAKTKVSGAITTIVTIIRIVGVCIAIVMLLTIAMKYMTAAAGEKAEIKKSAVQYVVGAIVLFAAVGILGIINDFSGNIKVS